MNFWTYKTLIAAFIFVWGILNITNGFNLFDETQLNIAKGICGMSIGLIIAFAEVNQRITRVL